MNKKSQVKGRNQDNDTRLGKISCGRKVGYGRKLKEGQWEETDRGKVLAAKCPT
jgi:hypothetical protein